MQGRCRRAQVNFWPIAIEVDVRCSASFLNFFTSVCNAAKELTEQNPKAFKQTGGKALYQKNKLHVSSELHKTNAKLALSRSAAARRALFRLPTGASDKCTMTRYRPTCLLLSRIVVRTVIANGILVMHGPPAFARGMPVHLHR
jgi:hypothetical protein